MNISPSGHRRRNRLYSFTLVELLAVMAIGSILAVLSLSAYAQIVRSQTISTSALMITGALDMARQTAITRNSHVEFRLYQLPDYNDASPTTDPLTVYRAFQTFLVTDNSTNAITQVSFLPGPAVISSNSTVSSLLTNNPTTPASAALPVAGSTFYQGTLDSATSPPTQQTIPTYGINYNAVVFDFLPTGGMDLPAATANAAAEYEWYLTVVLENDSPDPSSTAGLPKNFVTIQVDPFTGRAKQFQP